ncbi:hypothetical protein [Bradyrhizobium liaoningense]
MALEGLGFRGKLAEVECGARIDASFGLTGSLIFECCGAGGFRGAAGARAAKTPAAVSLNKSSSADDRDADPRTYDLQRRNRQAQRVANQDSIDPGQTARSWR